MARRAEVPPNHGDRGERRAVKVTRPRGRRRGFAPRLPCRWCYPGRPPGPSTEISTSEIFERNRLAVARLLPSELRPLEGAGNPVQQLAHPGRIDVGLVDRTGEQRAGERPFLHVGLLRPVSY